MKYEEIHPVKELRDCIRYCIEQNGMAKCKNCGLSSEMIDKALKSITDDCRASINHMEATYGKRLQDAEAFAQEPIDKMLAMAVEAKNTVADMKLIEVEAREILAEIKRSRIR